MLHILLGPVTSRKYFVLDQNFILARTALNFFSWSIPTGGTHTKQTYSKPPSVTYLLRSWTKSKSIYVKIRPGVRGLRTNPGFNEFYIKACGGKPLVL